MLVAEYDYDTDIEVQREESLMMGIRQGEASAKLETAKLMKQENCDFSFIEKITGLSSEEIKNL